MHNKINVVMAFQVVGRVNGFHLKKFVVSDSRHESSGAGIEGPDNCNSSVCGLCSDVVRTECYLCTMYCSSILSLIHS